MNTTKQTDGLPERHENYKSTRETPGPVGHSGGTVDKRKKRSTH